MKRQVFQQMDTPPRRQHNPRRNPDFIPGSTWGSNCSVYSNHSLEYGSSSVVQSFYLTNGFSILLDFVHYILLLALIACRLPYFSDDLAFDFRNDLYSNSCSNSPPQWSENSEDGRENISTCHCSDRFVFFTVSHKLQSSIPSHICGIHSNAEGFTLPSHTHG